MRGFYRSQIIWSRRPSAGVNLTWFKMGILRDAGCPRLRALASSYYGGADLYLIDRKVLDVSCAGQGSLNSLASLGVGWLVYDSSASRLLGRNDNSS